MKLGLLGTREELRIKTHQCRIGAVGDFLNCRDALGLRSLGWRAQTDPSQCAGCSEHPQVSQVLHSNSLALGGAGGLGAVDRIIGFAGL